MAAIARLHLESGWPRAHLIFESPTVTKDGSVVLQQDALDILLLEAPCTELAARMTIAAARPRVAVEAKADAKLLSKLLDEMYACQAAGAPHNQNDQKKCLAITVLRPLLFLGVAAAETWRIFTVVERDSRSVLGDELPNLGSLHFLSTTRPG